MDCQRCRRVRQVRRVDRILPSCAMRFVNAKAGVFAPELIKEVDVPVGVRRPNQAGNRIDGSAELGGHSGPFATVAEAGECALPGANVDHTLVSVCGEAAGLRLQRLAIGVLHMRKSMPRVSVEFCLLTAIDRGRCRAIAAVDACWRRRNVRARNDPKVSTTPWCNSVFLGLAPSVPYIAVEPERRFAEWTTRNIEKATKEV